MTSNKRKIQHLALTALGCSLASCLPPTVIERPVLPSLDYARNVHAHRELGPFAERNPAPEVGSQEFLSPAKQDGRAQIRYVKDWPMEPLGQSDMDMEQAVMDNVPKSVASNYAMNMPQMAPQQQPGYREFRAPQQTTRRYTGPLALGEPGATASIWRETNIGNNLFRDHRAFQPMDLVTIVISEQSQGSKAADTALEKESTFLAGITNLFNIETDITESNPGIDTSTLVNANLQTEFESEGNTTRSGSLTARISAMVVEVLPSGVMRIEGEKIISVNNEEQIMMISGLVRQRDLSSDNEVQSAKIANLRIDYFGRGVVGEQQYAGWLGRLFNAFWPF